MLAEFLTKKMSLTIKTIYSQSDLLALSPKILDLFSTCFSPKALEFGLWEWAYIKNPFGAPCVSIALDEERLVGHYATIPIDLVNSRGQKLKSHLSMTTMVDKHYVKFGLFKTLAQYTYDNLRENEIDLVYGFPNKNSKPGFKKRLFWKVNDMCLKYFETKREYINTRQYQDYYNSNAHVYTIDLSECSSLEWRLSKPGNKYIYENGAYFKSYSNVLDLIYIKNRHEFESSENNFGFNAICYMDESSDSDTSYHSGYRMLQSTSEFSLFSQLACSDIF